MKDARARRLDTVVVWRLGRLGRNLRHQILLLEELTAVGVVFVSLGEGIDTYKARRQPCVPFMAGSNSADTAGNRIKSTTKKQLWARYGQWSAQAKAAYDPNGTTELATLISRANDDFGQAEPARFAASAFAANGSPAYRYRFSHVQSAMGADEGGSAARRRDRVRVRHARRSAGHDAVA